MWEVHSLAGSCGHSAAQPLAGVGCIAGEDQGRKSVPGRGFCFPALMALCWGLVSRSTHRRIGSATPPT